MFAIMDHLIVFVTFSIIFGLALGARLNDGVREVHFKKMSNESKEYEFEYDLGNGDTFRGQTYALIGSIYFLFGAENEIYWTSIDSDEHNDEKFTKIVRKVKRDGDSIEFQDDHLNYYTSIGGLIAFNPYLTIWDMENICFTKAAVNETFNFTVSSSNNSKKYNGTTYRETADPKIQRFEVIDDRSTNGGLYEIHFTDIELLSDDVFCRGYDKLIKPYYWLLGSGQGMWINPSLLKTLVG